MYIYSMISKENIFKPPRSYITPPWDNDFNQESIVVYILVVN